MLNENMQKQFNDQLAIEFHSFYIYLGMSAWASSQSLHGMASWLSVQAKEELSHAMKIYNYILERDGEIQLKDLKRPEQNFSDPKALFAKVLEHEQFVTSSIYSLAASAQKENDFASSVFLQWFITEQVEEESNVRSVVEMLNRVETQQGLLYLDGKLVKRMAEK
ncbi:MAG: ferritin [Deltaproteobacteria bacterium]|nr:ferritin [Deltaproteobacteria bacterium]